MGICPTLFAAGGGAMGELNPAVGSGGHFVASGTAGAAVGGHPVLAEAEEEGGVGRGF